MSLRLRVLGATLFLLAVSVVGAFVIIRNLRTLVANQQLIVFKDRIFHGHEEARLLIQAAQAKLYQHQAGYTRDINRLVDDVARFESIILSISPTYRQHYSPRDCNACHDDAQRKVDALDETLREILANLDRYRESVSVVITTNDRQARLLNSGIANARGEQILQLINRVNESAGQMIARLREQNERILDRSERTIEAAVGVVGATFLLTAVSLLLAFHRLFGSLLEGTASLASDNFSLRLPLASRRDEIGLLASRFNLLAEHLEDRDRQIGERTAQLEEANRRLLSLNETLEQRVRERTRDLESSLEQVRSATAALEESKRRIEAANRELVRANQAKANFLSIISHELKTPLSVINGFLSLILDERYRNDPQHLREAVQISKRRGEQLSRMIDELIDLSRLDARAMVLRRQPTDAGEIVRDVAEQFQEDFRRQHLRCTLRRPPAPLRLECDPDKIRQVIVNLVANAVKFSPDGGEIELGAEEHGDDVLFSCRDTGIGIPEPEQEKIFEKFYQVDSSATRRFGGTGLGLSIAREIVGLHGGRIWVQSEPGKGSTFFVQLPRHAPAEAVGPGATAQLPAESLAP